MYKLVLFKYIFSLVLTLAVHYVPFSKYNILLSVFLYPYSGESLHSSTTTVIINLDMLSD